MAHVPSNSKADEKNHKAYKGNKEKFLKERDEEIKKNESTKGKG